MYFFNKIKLFLKRPSFRTLGLAVLMLAVCVIFALKTAPEYTSLDDVLKAGEITLITRKNTHCYYLYRGQTMGFEHDLAQAFADYLGVGLKVRFIEKTEDMIDSLTDGTGAFVAANMTKASEKERQIVFPDGYMTIQQYIITHRSHARIKRIKDLTGKTVRVGKGTYQQEIAEDLVKQGIDLDVQFVDDMSMEKLIQQVAQEKIEATIADSNIALLCRRHYPQVVISDVPGMERKLSWAVNSNAVKLLGRINSFFRTIKENGTFKEIYDRYYAGVDNFDYVDLMRYHRKLKKTLPLYSPLVKEIAGRYGFDWRLIAAQMYQESRFNPRAKSYADAYGLMQLRPSTAKSHGVQNILDPVQNITAGVKQLKYLYDYFEGTKEEQDRLFMALATYNIGQGHMWDARNLAEKKGLDPNKWTSLSRTLPLLEKQKYYKNTVYGYCRGSESVKYIKKIRLYYDILKYKEIEYTRAGNQEPQVKSRASS